MEPVGNERALRYTRVVLVFGSLYLFLLSINLLGGSFKMFGKGFAESMLEITSNPFAGLLIGIVATSLIQSSSTTTSIVVGMVAGGALTLDGAIPIIMGANIGTTITNTLVSLGHITNRIEFRRAFAAGTVHDIFNVCAVIVIFPIEMQFHIIARIATWLEVLFAGAGGFRMFNPLRTILDPALHPFEQLFSSTRFGAVLMMALAITLLILSLTYLVHAMRSLMLDKIELIINRYLFRNDFLGLSFGVILTASVQSSSVTTSLIVPLAGAGMVSLRQIFPYTLGANIGTTVTAILAAMATMNPVAVTVAFSHLCFNILGILIFYPLKFIPIRLAEKLSEFTTRSRRNMAVFVIVYLLMYFVPILLILLLRG